MTRRRAVVAAMAGVGLLAGLTAWSPAAEAEKKESAGDRKAAAWKLGTQTYTFRLFTLYEAIDKAQKLGLKYIEAYPGQKLSPEQKGVTFDQNASAEVIAGVKKKLDDAGIRMINFGVVQLKNNEAEARKYFEFAKKMGIETLTAEPAPEAMAMLDKLAQEYEVNIAIHNHPRPSHYWNPETVLEAIQGRSKRIGACADTGHWVRSGLDPVECLKKLEGRIISLHFKDLNEKKPSAHDVHWGEGVGNVRGQLEELHRQGFSGFFAIEYEHNWENSMPDLEACIKFFKATAKDLKQDVK